LRVEDARYMDPERCKPVFRYVTDLLKLLKDAKKVKLQDILRSKKVWLFFFALLIGEIAGIIASVQALALAKSNLCNGWPAVEGAVFASYKSVGGIFYLIWYLIRWACGQWKMFFGDFGIFAGPGTLYDWIAGGFHALLALSIFIVSGSEIFAVVLSTTVQAVIYLILTTRIFGALIIARG
jgi:hypothetical protein